MSNVQASTIDMNNPFNNGKVSANAPQGLYQPTKNAPAIKQTPTAIYSFNQDSRGFDGMPKGGTPSNPYGIQPANSTTTTTPVKTTDSTGLLGQTLNKGAGNTGGTQNNNGSTENSQNNQPVAQASYQGGQAIPAVGSATYTQAQSLAHPVSTVSVAPPATGNGTGSTGIYGQVVKSLGDTSPSTGATTAGQTLGGQSTSTPVNATTAQGLLQNYAQNPTPQVQQAQDQYNQFAKASPFLLSDVANNPNVAAEVSVGRGQALGQSLSAEQQALAQGVTNAQTQENQQIGSAENLGTQALTGQQQQIGAATNQGNIANTAQGNQITAQSNAGTLTQPQAGASYFGSPESGNVVGSGQGSTGNTLIDSSLNNAMNIISRGGSTTDAEAALVGGDVAKNAFIKKMQEFDPTWTPTSSNAIAAQNMSQASGYQQKATDLNTNLTQMKAVTAPILDLINKSGLNQQDNPFFNASINSYSSQLKDPAAQASLKSGIAEIKTYVSNILGTGGDLTPTAVTQMVNSFDPGNFTASQLTSFLDNLNNYGQARLQGFQQSSQGSYGGAQGFTGAQANPSTNANISTPNPDASVTTNDPVKQALIGGGMQALGGIEGLISGIASKVLH